MENVKYAQLSGEDVLKNLQASIEGLSSVQVAQRLKKFGYNELHVAEISWWHILWNQFRSPFIFLLIIATIISLFLADYNNAILIFVILSINSVLGFYQEYMAYRTEYFLRNFTSNTARVLRDGHELNILQKEVVPGDIIILQPGDIVPADLRLLEVRNLTLDESMLTGESVPQQKNVDTLSVFPANAQEATNLVFANTIVVSGSGIGVAYATGRTTEFSSIAKLALETEHRGVFQKDLAQFSRFLMIVIFATLVGIVSAHLFFKKTEIHFLEILVFALALAIGITPEALPVVTTFALARGARRLARNKVLVKRLSSIDDLGSIQVLCTDKTGTLTENNLRVISTFKGDQNPLFWALLARDTEELPKQQHQTLGFDESMYAALSADEQNALLTYNRIVESPFDPQRKRSSYIVTKDKRHWLVVRGAFEELSLLCDALPENIQTWISDQGKQAHRIIAVAAKQVAPDECEKSPCDEKNLTFIGCIAFEDPIKKTAVQAVQQAKHLGIHIKILTGDAPEVAGVVAHAIGLIEDATQVLTGKELQGLSNEEQKSVVQRYQVFARVSPQQKYEIIKLLQENYEVGFLGEGINDAPALKIANVGMVVQTAVDSARDAADIILLKKSLLVIVEGIRQGRIVFANTLKYVLITLSANFGNFYSIAIASLFIDFLPMLPVQILLVNMLSDFPMIMIATDNVDPQELQKPTNFDFKAIISKAMTLGLISSIFDMILFGYFYRISAKMLQTAWFVMSILSELVFIISARTKKFFIFACRPSYPLLILLIITGSVTLMLPFNQLTQELFSFTHISAQHMAFISGLVVSYFIATETVKLLYVFWSTRKSKKRS